MSGEPDAPPPASGAADAEAEGVALALLAVL